MKRFLSAGEGYAPFPTNINYRMPRYFLAWRAPLLFVFSFFMCLQAGAKESAPTHRDRAVPVAQSEIYIRQIGDKLPRNFLIGYDPMDPERKTSLADLRGKAVIIDAWATWCGACISKFPILDSISKAYDGKLEILLVAVLSGDTPETIRSFVSEYKEKHPEFSLTFLVEEPRLRNSFAFSSFPHYIWIDPNRRVRAFTRISAFEDQNLQRLMAGLPIYVPVKLK